MHEGTPRPSFIYLRGEFLSPGDPVVPGVPAALHPLPGDTKLDRLGLAKWLVDPENPLVGRVAVNRLWQELFGVGIVETAEEFGTQGEPPSHPELLDWLALDFRDHGWDTKRLLKLIVTSATYRQSRLGEPQNWSKRSPGQPLTGAGAAMRPGGRVGARSGARGQWSAKCQNVWSAGATAATVVRPGRGLWQQHRLEDERRRGSTSSRNLHALAAQPALSFAGGIRRAGAQRVLDAPDAHQYAAAGVGDAQRSGVYRMCPGPGATGHRRRGRQHEQSCATRIIAGRRTRGVAARSRTIGGGASASVAPRLERDPAKAKQMATVPRGPLPEGTGELGRGSLDRSGQHGVEPG